MRDPGLLHPNPHGDDRATVFGVRVGVRGLEWGEG